MSLVFAFVLSILIVLAFAALSDHRVRSYYVGGYGTTNQLACVCADLPWEVDEKVTCFTDFEAAYTAAKKANELVRK